MGTKIDLHRRPSFIFYSAATHPFDPAQHPAAQTPFLKGCGVGAAM